MIERYVGPTIIAVCTKIAEELGKDIVDLAFFDKENMDDISYALTWIGCIMLQHVEEMNLEQRSSKAAEIIEKIKAALERNQDWILPAIITDPGADDAESKKRKKFIQEVKLGLLIDLSRQEHLSEKDISKIEATKQYFKTLKIPIPEMDCLDTGNEYRQLLDFFIDAIKTCRTYYAEQDQGKGSIRIAPHAHENKNAVEDGSETGKKSEDLMDILADLTAQMASGELEPDECWQGIKDMALALISSDSLKDTSSLEFLVRQLIAPASKDIATNLVAILKAVNDIAENLELKEQSERSMKIKLARLKWLRKQLIDEVGLSESSADAAILDMLRSGGSMATLAQILPAARKSKKQ